MNFAIGLAVGGWFMHFFGKGAQSAAYATGFTIGAIFVAVMEFNDWWLP